MAASLVSGLVSPLIQLLGGGTNQATDVGPTPEQAMLSQFLGEQQKLAGLTQFAGTNTEMSTGATMKAASANLGAATNLAGMSDVNAQQALQVANSGSALQNLISSNQQFGSGAQSVGGTTNNTFNSPGNQTA